MTFTPQLIDNIAPGESLRSGATKINTNFEAIETMINNMALAVVSLAGENLSPYQLVYVDSGAYYVATNNSSEAESAVVGMAQENIVNGQTGLIQFGQSIVTNPLWLFVAGDLLYLGEDGAITNDASSADFIVPVGFAITPTSILFNLQTGFTHTMDAGTI